MNKTEDFIEKAKIVHGDKYDYSKVEYKGSKTKVCIVCTEHGEFQQVPNNHLQGQGCPLCGKKKTKALNNNKFIERAIKAHGDKYDYSKVNYKNVNTKVCISCPEHGEFWQFPRDHYSKKCGCPKCASKINKSENKIYNLIKSNFNFEVIQSYKPEFLKTNKNGQEIDIFIPSLNIGIEYQGIQHFKPIKYWGGNKKLSEIKRRDNIKNKLCNENNVTLLYFTYEDVIDDSIITDENKLIDIIKDKI